MKPLAWILGALLALPGPAVSSGTQDVNLDASMLDMPLALHGRITRQPGEDPELTLDGTLGPLTLSVRGTLGTTSALTATITAEDLTALFEQLALDVPLSGPLHLTADITATRESISVRSDTTAGPLRTRWHATYRDNGIAVDATIFDVAELGRRYDIHGLPATELRLGGLIVLADDAVSLQNGHAAIGDAAARFDLRFTGGKARGTFTAGGPRLADLGFELPALPFNVTTGVVLDGGTAILEPLRLEAGASDVTGTVTVASREPLKLIAQLESAQVDVTPWRSDQPPQDLAAGAGPSAGDRLFDPAPLPLTDLRSADVELQLDVARLVDGNLHAHDLTLAVDLEDGKLDGRFAFRGADEGRISGHVALDAAAQPPRLSMSARADAMRLNLMSGVVTGPEQIPPVGVRLDLRALGASPRELAASATGKVLITQGAGRLDMGAAMPLLTGDLLTQLLRTLNPFYRQAPYSTLECSVVLLALQDGAGQMPVMLLQDDRIQVIGRGTLDLATERLQLEFKTQPRQGIRVSADMFVTPFVMVSGTLARPTIRMNKRGVLLHGGAAFLTGGLSLLGEALLNRAGGDKDHCTLALTEAEALLEPR